MKYYGYKNVEDIFFLIKKDTYLMLYNEKFILFICEINCCNLNK